MTKCGWRTTRAGKRNSCSVSTSTVSLGRRRQLRTSQCQLCWQCPRMTKCGWRTTRLSCSDTKGLQRQSSGTQISTLIEKRRDVQGSLEPPIEGKVQGTESRCSLCFPTEESYS